MLLFNSSIHTYFRLFMLSQKKNYYPLTHHICKMSPHYLVKRTNFSSDWRYVAFLQTLVALKKASCGLALVALRRTGCDVLQIMKKWNVRQATLQQVFKVTTFCTDTCFSLFYHWSTASSTTLCWNSAHVATLSQLVHIADWYSIRVKNEKDEKFVY